MNHREVVFGAAALGMMLAACSGTAHGDGNTSGGAGDLGTGLGGIDTGTGTGTGTSGATKSGTGQPSASDGGATPPPAPSSSGSSGTCSIPVTNSCTMCLNQSCCAVAAACNSNPQCSGLNQCLLSCGASTGVCADGCLARYPNGRTALQAAEACAEQSCASACGG